MLHLEYKRSMDIVIPIGIYCYFGFDLIEKLRSFRFVKHKASINAISYLATKWLKR